MLKPHLTLPCQDPNHAPFNSKYKNLLFFLISHFPPLAFKTSPSLILSNPSIFPFVMEMPRTPDLPAWDIVPPPLDALRCFGLAETEDVPLLVDSAGHIQGAVTGVVSTHSSYFL